MIDQAKNSLDNCRGPGNNYGMDNYNSNFSFFVKSDFFNFDQNIIF